MDNSFASEAERAGFVVLLEMTMDRTNPGAYLPPPFLTAAPALGMHGRGAQYTFSPETLVRDLLARASLAAKLITRELGAPRHAAFDTLAVAGGFAGWQHLSRHLAGVKAGAPDSPAAVNWGKALVPLLPLTYIAEPGFEIPAPLRAAFTGLAEKLGQSLGSSVQDVLDRVGAPLLGERSWAEVEARQTTGDGSPLYRFEVEGPGTAARGEFRASRLPNMLTDALDDLGDIPEDLGDIPNEEVREAWVRFVTPLEDEHPDFLEGGLALARLLSFDDPRAGLDAVGRYVQRADALIPRGFKGKLSWDWIENRFYFRLLWLQAELAVRARDPGTAARALRKLDRRILEREVFDVRSAMPYFMLLAGDSQAARKACDKLPRREPSFAWVARAFAAFACGDPATFRLELLRAVFLIPGLRDLLTLAAIHESEYLEEVHAALKGGTAFNWLGLRVLHQVPGLLPAVLAVLNAPDVRRRVDASWARFKALPELPVGKPGPQEKAAIDTWLQELDDALRQLTQLEATTKESA